MKQLRLIIIGNIIIVVSNLIWQIDSLKSVHLVDLHKQLFL